MAFHIKKERAEEDLEMSRPFRVKVGDFAVFEHAERLFLPDDKYQDLIKAEWRAERAKEITKREEEKEKKKRAEREAKE
jgi:hypothetical protein